MRRLMFALVLLIGSTAPAVGFGTARADEPCVSETTTSTVVWPANQHVDQCVPVDVPPAGDSTCVHRYGGFPPPGTLTVDVWICVPT